MATIYEKLKAYSDSDYYGFHMPGHKRKMHMSWDADPYTVDITEIEGFDDLHHAEGILKEAQERAARIYHADETHFLVNGSTVGILSAIAGVTNKGDQILVARNCHKSVYHAIYMNELNPVYLYPRFDSELQLNIEISAEDVRRALNRYPQIRAVMIVSPTYDGIVSDVAEIAKAAHEKGLPLIVDEAHGAHFGFHPYFPENANQQGADVVIHSVHKTLPAPTQTALLHMNGNLADREAVRKYLHMFQSSSPSYILMAGIDACMGLLETKADDLFSRYADRLQRTRKKLGKLKNLELEESEHFDRSKIVISTKNTMLTGKQLYEELLEHYHLQMEMAAGAYIIAMTSIGDTDAGMERLEDALFEIDMNWEVQKTTDDLSVKSVKIGILPQLEQICSSGDVWNRRNREQRRKSVRWDEAVGQISAEYAYLYPPGIPLIVPGERISEEAIRLLLEYRSIGFEIEGLKRQGQIEVLYKIDCENN